MHSRLSQDISIHLWLAPSQQMDMLCNVTTITKYGVQHPNNSTSYATSQQLQHVVCLSQQHQTLSATSQPPQAYKCDFQQPRNKCSASQQHTTCSNQHHNTHNTSYATSQQPPHFILPRNRNNNRCTRSQHPPSGLVTSQHQQHVLFNLTTTTHNGVQPRNNRQG
jgi:hypothetical protein